MYPDKTLLCLLCHRGHCTHGSGCYHLLPVSLRSHKFHSRPDDLLYLVLPALCTVLAVKFAVLLALFLSKLMGTRPFTGFLESVGGALNILLAVCLFAAVSGIILFASCIETASVF